MGTNPFQLTSAEREALVREHLPLVRAIASKIKRQHRMDMDLDDLVSDGHQGLVDAVNRYDQRSTNSFVTYATYRIRGAIYDGMRRMGVVDRTTYRHVQLARQANDYLQAVADEPVPPDARGVEATAARIEDAIAGVATIAVLALEGVPEGDVEAALDLQRSVAPGSDDPLLRKRLATALATLTADESAFLKRLYVDDLILADIAREMKRSKAWVTRYHARVIAKLRGALSDSIDDYESG